MPHRVIPTNRRLRSATSGQHGFTLVELLVVIGIIGLLISLLLPAIASARSAARAIACGSNVRQICVALHVYAAENRGCFPPNTLIPARSWYDYDRAGRFLVPSQKVATGPVLTCPEDPDAVRSYSMNVWASSMIERFIAKPFVGSPGGIPWKANTSGASSLILVTERWSSGGNAANGYTSPATFSNNGDTPGHRFGGGIGLVAPLSAGRWGMVNCELAYARHRARKGPGSGTQPIGRVQIGYADGHVALKSNSDLVHPDTGLSTLDSRWSPLDAELNH